MEGGVGGREKSKNMYEWPMDMDGPWEWGMGQDRRGQWG